jgi:hypothetical protein
MHYYCLSTAYADSFGLEGSADSLCRGAGSVEEVEGPFLELGTLSITVRMSACFQLRLPFSNKIVVNNM